MLFTYYLKKWLGITFQDACWKLEHRVRFQIFKYPFTLQDVIQEIFIFHL